MSRRQTTVEQSGVPLLLRILYFFIFGYPEGSFALERFQLVDGFPLYSREANDMRGKPILLGTGCNQEHGRYEEYREAG